MKIYKLYEKIGGTKYFYNEEKNTFHPDNRPTLYNEVDCYEKRRLLLVPRIENYQKTGNWYTEIWVLNRIK